jgi:hypothetical protein
MPTRTYTIAEARAALPQVKALMASIQTARREVLRLRPEAWPALRKAPTNGGSRPAGEMAQQFAKVEEALKAITGLGILVKDLDRGLVDFLGTRDGREVYLCWQHGEEDIEFWHDLDAGFAGRRPIDAQVR